jgi:hypothetical protein
MEIPKVLQMDLAKSRADNFRLIHSGREAQRRSRYASLVTCLHNYGSPLVMKNSECARRLNTFGQKMVEAIVEGSQPDLTIMVISECEGRANLHGPSKIEGG